MLNIMKSLKIAVLECLFSMRNCSVLFLRMAKAKYKVMFIDKLVSVMTAGGIGERLGSVFIIIRERFYTDRSNFGLKKALKNLIFFTIPCYTKHFIKKLLVGMGLNKIVSIYFKIKYPEK